MEDLSRLCIHTITTKPWSLDTSIERFAQAGARGIAVWRDLIADRDIASVRKQIQEAGLEVVSLVRGGFFPSVDAKKRKEAINENLNAIDEAEKLGASLLVLVCGAEPEQTLSVSRSQILEGIHAISPAAKDAGVRLAIEPLHPMYADTRSAITTLRDANDACAELNLENVGVALDVYHVWWDPELKVQIERCGQMNKLFGFHVCDWRVPTRDFFQDRVIMGDGCIDVPGIRRMVDETGYDGFIEVEIFSKEYWSGDQQPYLDRIISSYREHV